MWILMIVLYFLTTIYTFFEASYLFVDILGNPLAWIFFILLLASLIYIPVATKGATYFRAFLASSISILSLIGLPAVSMFPRLVPSITNIDYSLTIYNASSTSLTLTVMLIIALVGMPVVIVYNWYIYNKFRGKTVITEDSY